LYSRGTDINLDKDKDKIKDKENNKDESMNILNINIENEINTINEKEDMIQIEFSNGEILKEEIKILTKYPNSLLSACINGKISLPKRNGHFFLDRNSNDFKLILYYLKKSKIPKFQNLMEEKNFFKEMDFWKIPIKISNKKRLQFDLTMTSNCFNIDKTNSILTKSNNLHGITLMNISLNATSPYIEFTIFLNNYSCKNKKFFLGLVDKNKFLNKHIHNSFEDKSAPYVFYWDIYKNKIIKNKSKGETISMGVEKECRCFGNNNEIKFAMKYNHLQHSIRLFRNDIELGVEIQNIAPGLCPAIELHMEDCKIKLSNNNDYQESFYL